MISDCRCCSSVMNHRLSMHLVTIWNEGSCPGLHRCPWTSLVSSISSVYRPDEHTDSLHGVEAAAIVGPEDSILKFAAVYTSRIPYAIQVGLAASIVPPASFMEMRTVTCNRNDGYLSSQITGA